jgi:hypothetical protein
MTNAWLRVCLFASALLLAVCGKAHGQRVDTPAPSAREQVLFLNFRDNGQHLAATVGQQIEITLGTVGPKQYGEPQISSSAIELESTALDWPPNPGGPTFIYIFEAVSEGEAQVMVPIFNAESPDLAKRFTFAVTIRVEPTAKRTALRASMTPDQANTEPWKDAWTNLNSAVRQSFVPSLPRLIGVEVELVVANPGPTSDEVTMTLTNPEGEGMAVVSKSVPVANCSHVLFLLPNGGAQVSPGQVYSIGLRGDGGVFGWKYVVGGYKNGAAFFNGKPLMRDTRSTFLFRTFGAN